MNIRYPRGYICKRKSGCPIMIPKVRRIPFLLVHPNYCDPFLLVHPNYCDLGISIKTLEKNERRNTRTTLFNYPLLEGWLPNNTKGATTEMPNG